MTKEELIKVFSAYLPYNLKLQYNYFPNDKKITTAFLSGISNTEIETTYKRKIKGAVGDIISWEGNNNFFELQVKPVLYDLSYLTKEIEHEGENTIILSEYIYNNWFIRIRVDGHFSLDNGDGTSTGFQYKSAPYDLIQLLLKYHFNVFNLPEGEYINKANLTKK